MVMTSSLLGASIDGAVFAAIVWLVIRFVHLSPSTRTLLWWCAAAKFVLALTWTTPLALPLLPPAQAAAKSASAKAVAAETGVPADVWTRVSTRVSSRVGPRLATRFALPGADREPAESTMEMSGLSALARGLGEWRSFAALGWIGGLLLVAFVAVRRWSATASLVRSSTPASDEVVARTADLASRLRLRRVPAVRVTERIETPLVTGFVRPVVLLPGERFNVLNERQREMALCHELAHLKRADLWLGCVPALAERLFFFHPLAHLVSREYSLAREAACDAAVVETLDAAPHEYGCLLLALGVSRPQAGAAANAAWSFVHLKRRIAMLQELPSGPRSSRAVAVAAVAVAVLALLPLRLVARPGSAPPPTSSTFATVSQDRPAPRGGDVELPAGLEVENARRERAAQELNFVLLLEGRHTMSGSEQNLERARSFQRNGEPLLWVRSSGREYVIRDQDVLRQARDAWKIFNEKELEKVAKGDHVEALAKLVADSPLAAQLGADAARLGVEVGAQAAEAVLETLRNLHFSDRDFEKMKELGEFKALKDLELQKELKALMHSDWVKQLESLKELDQLKELHKLDTLREVRESESLREALRELHESLGEIERNAGQDVERSMREHRDHLHDMQDRLHDMKDHMHDMKDRLHEQGGKLHEMLEPLHGMHEPLAEMGRHLGEMGREIGEHTGRAMERMRELIERAIAEGTARPVK